MRKLLLSIWALSVAACAVQLTGGAFAAERDWAATRLALDLGTVLGSEEPCGLEFDQRAIEAYVAKSFPAENMTIMADMNAAAASARIDLQQRFTESQKAAHCAQVRRVAKANGFIE